MWFLNDGQEEQPSGEKSGDEVASLFMVAVDRREQRNRREYAHPRGKYDQRDWQTWEGIQKQSTTVGIVQSWKPGCEFC